jgi:hypothetical protein
LFALGCKFGQGPKIVHHFFSLKGKELKNELTGFVNGAWSEPNQSKLKESYMLLFGLHMKYPNIHQEALAQIIIHH